MAKHIFHSFAELVGQVLAKRWLRRNPADVNSLPHSPSQDSPSQQKRSSQVEPDSDKEDQQPQVGA